MHWQADSYPQRHKGSPTDMYSLYVDLSVLTSFFLFCTCVHNIVQLCTTESTLAISENVAIKFEKNKKSGPLSRGKKMPLSSSLAVSTWLDGKELTKPVLWVTRWAHGNTSPFCSSNHHLQPNTSAKCSCSRVPTLLMFQCEIHDCNQWPLWALPENRP